MKVIVLDKRRRYAAAAGKFWRLTEEQRGDIIERAYEHLDDLTFFEQVAVDEDAGAAVDAYWNSLTPGEQDAEIAAFEEWEREDGRAVRREE